MAKETSPVLAVPDARQGRYRPRRLDPLATCGLRQLTTSLYNKAQTMTLPNTPRIVQRAFFSLLLSALFLSFAPPAQASHEARTTYKTSMAELRAERKSALASLRADLSELKATFALGTGPADDALASALAAIDTAEADYLAACEVTPCGEAVHEAALAEFQTERDDAQAEHDADVADADLTHTDAVAAIDSAEADYLAECDVTPCSDEDRAATLADFQAQRDAAQATHDDAVASAGAALTDTVEDIDAAEAEYLAGCEITPCGAAAHEAVLAGFQAQRDAANETHADSVANLDGNYWAARTALFAAMRTVKAEFKIARRGLQTEYKSARREARTTAKIERQEAKELRKSAKR